MSGLDEDTAAYVAWVDSIVDNPPPAPAGFELIECGGKHWPMYTVADSYGYPPSCPICAYDSERTRREQLEHAHHWPWRRWALTPKVLGWLYSLGIVGGYGQHWGGACRGCVTTIRWTGTRSHILGIRREVWRCWLVYHHRRGEDLGAWGYCGKDVPWPCCGSTRRDHADGCPEQVAA